MEQSQDLDVRKIVETIQGIDSEAIRQRDG